MDVKFSTEDLENERFKFWNVFSSMGYDNGRFEFEWNSKMIPHILELKEKYVLTDLTITAKFKSSFSWTLYEFLKAHYGYWYVKHSKESLMRLFGVEDRKSYVKSTGLFKQGVLDVAIKEINEHTELHVWYKEIRKGRAIVGFEIHWSSGDTRIAATEKQLERLKAIYDLIEKNALKYLQTRTAEERSVMTMLGEVTMKNKTWDMTVAKMSDEDADEAIKDAQRTLERLEFIYGSDKHYKEKSGDRSDIYYNWLDEDGNVTD